MYIARINVLISLLLACLSGCNSCVNELRFENASYRRSLEISIDNLPPGLIDHFPSKIYGIFNMKSNYPNNNNFRGHYGSVLLNYSSSDQIENIKELFILLDSNKINLNDSCLLVIRENVDFGISHESLKCWDRLSVIPDIEVLFENKFEKEIMIDNFNFYLIESDKGEFIDEKYFNAKPNKLNFIGHGFSKGIAINCIDNIVIYWGIVW